METRDPLAGSPWSTPGTVAGFVQSPPNEALLHAAADIGCGAGRNAVPLARAGWDVYGVDLSLPMVTTALARVAAAQLTDRARVLLAPMDRLPFASASFDFIVALHSQLFDASPEFVVLFIPIEWIIWILALPSGLLIGYYANQRSDRRAGPWGRILVNGLFAGFVTGLTPPVFKRR